MKIKHKITKFEHIRTLLLFPFFVAILFIYVITHSFVTILFVGLGTGIGLWASKHLIASFSFVEKRIPLLPGETILVESRGPTHIIFPKKAGGFLAAGAPLEATLYLTNKGIMAEPPNTGAIMFGIPLQAVSGYKKEKKFFSSFIRIAFADKDGDREALLMTDKDTDLWLKSLSEMLPHRHMK